jgi:hypothetical protein
MGLFVNAFLQPLFENEYLKVPGEEMRFVRGACHKR